MEKPQEISRFAALATTACVINAASALFLVDLTGPQRIAIPIVAIVLIALILTVALFRSQIARILFTLWLAYGFGKALMTYSVLFAAKHAAIQPLVIAGGFLALLLNAAALLFLWSRVSTAWLQKPSNAS